MSKVEELKVRIKKLEDEGGRLVVDWADGADPDSEESAEELLRLLDDLEEYKKLPERTKMLLSIEKAIADFKQICDLANFDVANVENMSSKEISIRSEISGLADMAALELSNWTYEISALDKDTDRP